MDRASVHCALGGNAYEHTTMKDIPYMDAESETSELSICG